MSSSYSVPSKLAPNERTPLHLVLVLTLVYTLWKIVNRITRAIRVKSLIRNLPTTEKGSWVAGNIPEIFNPSNVEWHREFANRWNGAGAVQFHALFRDEQLYISDPRALHHILVKEQHIFEEPSHLISTNQVILGEGLLSTIGEQHKRQRRVLNPVFHIKHMRKLIPTFCRITDKVVDVLEDKVKSGIAEVNMFEWLSRTALELVGQGGLGHSFDSLAEGEVSDYTKVAKELIPAVSELHIPLLILPVIRQHFPLCLTRWISQGVVGCLPGVGPFKAIQKVKEIAEFMEQISWGILDGRRRQVITDGEEKVDILSVLLKANEGVDKRERMSDHEVIGSMTTLTFAAQDTTSSALSRILHLLASHPSQQEHLRGEIRNLGPCTGEYWEYDQLNALDYLDAVCRESLRLYPPVTWLWRVARHQTSLPLRHPIIGTDGQLITSLPIAQGQGIVLGLTAANLDQRTFGPDALSWSPERWLTKAARSNIARDQGDPGFEDGGIDDDCWGDGVRQSNDWKEAKLPGVYSGMMTFSGGGRACIGFKFSLLEMKVVLAMLINKFHFSVPDGKEVVWRMTNIQTPTIKGKESETPSLLLNISLAPY